MTLAMEAVAASTEARSGAARKAVEVASKPGTTRNVRQAKKASVLYVHRSKRSQAEGLEKKVGKSVGISGRFMASQCRPTDELQHEMTRVISSTLLE